MLALDATVTIVNAKGEAERPLADFLAARDALGAAVVKDVRFALPPAGAFRFRKVTRKHPRGASVLSIAALLPVDAGKTTGARVAYGAMAPTAVRATAVEKALEGRPLDAQAIDAAVKVATEGCAAHSDPQASAWYRNAVLPVHLKRLLAGEA